MRVSCFLLRTLCSFLLTSTAIFFSRDLICRQLKIIGLVSQAYLWVVFVALPRYYWVVNFSSLRRDVWAFKRRKWKTSSARSPCSGENVVNVFTCLCRLWARLIWKLAPGFCSSWPELHEYPWTDLPNYMAAMGLRDSPLSPGALRIPYQGLTLGKSWYYDVPYRKFYFLSHKLFSYKFAIVVFYAYKHAHTSSHVR